MGDDFLSQDEIDALLSGGSGGGGSAGGGESLTLDEAEILKEVASIMASATGNVVGMLAGRTVSASVGFAEALPQNTLGERIAPSLFAFSMNWDGLDNAPARLAASEKGALTLADLMMGGDAKELPEEANDLYLSAAQEGLSQLVGAALTNLSGLLGGARLAPTSTSGKLTDASWLPFDGEAPTAPIWVAQVGLSVEGVDPFDLFLTLPVPQAKGLANRIRQAVSPAEAPPAPKPAAPKAPAAPTHAPAPVPAMQGGSAEPVYAPRSASLSTAPVDARPAEFLPLHSAEGAAVPGNIDLIVDIPVRITVELGRARKTIGEVLGMGPGSVVELNRMAGEPVDVLVNGKLIARGEVVVIDESFGIRVTEIVSRAERIRSMGI